MEAGVLILHFFALFCNINHIIIWLPWQTISDLGCYVNLVGARSLTWLNTDAGVVYTKAEEVGKQIGNM